MMLSQKQCIGRSLLVVMLSLVGAAGSSCPDACEQCTDSHLYCVNGGLTEIPTVVQSAFRKVTIQKQQFAYSDLSSANFSSFLGVVELSIKSSNLNKVLPSAFSRLTSLQQLDLSDNAELNVSQRAFEGLDLQLLKLDNMGIITLDLDAFQGLKVSSLSIQNSNLLSLPLRLIKPLSKSLTKLYLKNNLLRTLDPGLQLIFRSMDILELQKNPFICNCSILWLSNILRSNVKAQTNSNKPTFESAEELFPSCVSPAELRKKFLHEITWKLKDCIPPKIVRIDIAFDTPSAATIDCFTDDRTHRRDVTSVGWLLEEGSGLTQSVKIVRQSHLKNFLCRAMNVNGRTEMRLRINWVQPPTEDAATQRTLTERSNHSNSQTNKSILYRHVFSLFEMICAILGTVTVTVVTFLVLCRYRRCCIRIPMFLGHKDHKAVYSAPPIYERGVYVDEIRFHETDLDVRMFPPPPPTPPPFPMNRIILSIL